MKRRKVLGILARGAALLAGSALVAISPLAGGASERIRIAGTRIVVRARRIDPSRIRPGDDLAG